MNPDVIQSLINNRTKMNFMSGVVFGKVTTIIAFSMAINGSSLAASDVVHNDPGEDVRWIGWMRVEEVSTNWVPVQGYHYYRRAAKPSMSDIEASIGIDDTQLRVDVLNLNASPITAHFVIWVYTP